MKDDMGNRGPMARPNSQLSMSSQPRETHQSISPPHSHVAWYPYPHRTYHPYQNLNPYQLNPSGRTGADAAAATVGLVPQNSLNVGLSMSVQTPPARIGGDHVPTIMNPSYFADATTTMEEVYRRHVEQHRQKEQQHQAVTPTGTTQPIQHSIPAPPSLPIPRLVTPPSNSSGKDRKAEQKRPRVSCQPLPSTRQPPPNQQPKTSSLPSSSSSQTVAPKTTTATTVVRMKKEPSGTSPLVTTSGTSTIALENVKHTTSPEHSIDYLGIYLKREIQFKPSWGITLQMMESNSSSNNSGSRSLLVVARSNLTTSDPTIVLHAKSRTPPPHVAWKNHKKKSDPQISKSAMKDPSTAVTSVEVKRDQIEGQQKDFYALFQDTWTSRATHPVSKTHPDVIGRGIHKSSKIQEAEASTLFQSGDVIISINGRIIDKFGDSDGSDRFERITSYMMKQERLALVVLRHRSSQSTSPTTSTTARRALFSDNPRSSNINKKATTKRHRNELFLGTDGKPIEFDDSTERNDVDDFHYYYNYSWDDWRRSFLQRKTSAECPIDCLPPITGDWLTLRKQQWRRRYAKSLLNIRLQQQQQKSQHLTQLPKDGFHQHFAAMRATPIFLNTLFRVHQITDSNDSLHSKQQRLPFDDQHTDGDFASWVCDPTSVTHTEFFLLPTIQTHFPRWLQARKLSWKKRYTARLIDDNIVSSDEEDDSPAAIARDFWTRQGFSSLEEWCFTSTRKWKRSYSWNRRKRQRIAQQFEEVVHFSPHDENEMLRWLQVRKNQWRLLRRKRQRVLLANEGEKNSSCSFGLTVSGGGIAHTTGSGIVQDFARDSSFADQSIDGAVDLGLSSKASSASGTTASFSSTSTGSTESFLMRRGMSQEMVHIDALLEEEEARRKRVQSTFDLMFIFDRDYGAPDDVIAQCLSFLPPSEHGKLLCVNSKTSKSMKDRDDMWRSLCPAHWTLPRRPRKRWCHLYLTKMRQEEEMARKRSDEVLNKVSATLLKGDHLQKIEKLVTSAEKRFGFCVDYTSGVICERNSMLNLAVIHRRTKTVKWLVETKEADVETSDRGNFTPLLNAAFAGDRYLVRYLLSKGCNRNKKATAHYTQPLASPDFVPLNAEGWARKRGHNGIADLIKMGL